MQEENLLINKSVPGLLWIYARPAMLASLITGLYGIIDGIFIGQKMGSAGIAAITLAFPITTFLIGIGVLLGTGTSIPVSRYLALGRERHARGVIRRGLRLFFLFGALLSLGGFFSSTVMHLLGKGSDTNVVDLAQSFVSILLFGSLIYMAPIFFSELLKNLGKPKAAMIAMICGTVTTIVLDYLLIFLANLEMLGAALATISGQLVAFLLILFFIRSHPLWQVRTAEVKVRLRSYLEILRTGFTSFVIQLSTMALLLVHNRLFLHYGDETYVSSFGIIGYALTAYWLLINGFVGGTQPIVSYNFASSLLGRVRRVLKLNLIFILCFSVLYSLLFYLFPDVIISIFSGRDIGLMVITRRGFYLVMYALPFAGINILAAMYFQAIGKVRTSIFLVVSRVVFFMIPLILILPARLGVNGIYLIVPLSEVGTSLVSMGFLYYNLYRSRTYIQPTGRKEAVDGDPDTAKSSLGH